MADVFEILADPTRRRMLDVLRRGERSVGDLVDALDLSQPGVSKQLRILHEAGLVEVRPEGQRRIYSLRAEPLRHLDQWISAYRPYWTSKLDALEKHLDRKERTR